MDQTANDTPVYTDGTIRPSAVDLILEKLESGVRWVVIIGAPGEGKTTLGFWVIKDMLEKGNSAVKLSSPEEYFVVTDNSDERVIFMLDDVLGAFAYNSVESSNWKPFIIGVHENMTLGQKNGKYSKGCFLFIGRRNVFQDANEHFGKYENSIFHKDVYDLNERYQLTTEERLQILDHHLSRGSISLSQHEKIHICSDKLCPHGFPHCYKMFVELHKLGKPIDHVKFFTSPLLFLGQTTKVLLKEKNTKTFFKEMLKANGELDINEIENEDLRDIMSETKPKLLGMYVRDHDNLTRFSHPSVYESVALSLGKKDPVFIVQHCHVTFIMQRVKVRPGDFEDYIYINLSTNQIAKHLSSTFAKSIQEGVFSVIEHEACEDDTWFRMMLQKAKLQDDKSSLMDQALWKQKNKSGYTLFHVAVECGNMTAIKVLLEMGSDVNLPCPGWWWRGERTALHVLCMKTTLNLDVVGSMILYGADINMGDSHDTTVLHCLCGRQDVHDDIIESVIALKANVTIADRYGKTALHYLCERPQVDMKIIDVLTKHGISVNKADIHGKTVLHYMCQRNDDNRVIIESLISNHGAEVNICDHSDKTTLHYACDRDIVNTELINLLIQHGCDVNMADGLKKTPLHYVCEKDVVDISLLKFLVKRGVDVNSTQLYGKTALHYLCERNVDKDVVESLIELGANINKSSDYGKTALHYACNRDDTNIRVIDALVQNDADTNIADTEGFTALHYICRKHPVDTALLELMIHHGADVNHVCISGRPALYDIQMRSKEDILAVDILIQHGASVSLGYGKTTTFLHKVCSMADVDFSLLNTVVQHCLDVSSCTDGLKRTPLHTLCDESKLDFAVVDFLIQHGLDINATDSSGDTALHCIDRNVKNGPERDVLLSKMMDKGADPLKQNKGGYQAIHSLAEQRILISSKMGLTDLMTNIIRGELSAYAVSVDDKDSLKTDVFGRTALHHLCLSEYIDKDVLTLLSKSSDVNKSDRYGNTALHCLSRRYNIHSIDSLSELVDILIRHGADVNTSDEYGVSALFYLRRVMDQNLTDILTSNDVDMDLENGDGLTLLHFLCIMGYSDCMEMVIPKLKDLNKSVKHRCHPFLENGMTALHIACEQLHDDSRNVQILLKAGADINITDEQGRTLLHLASDDCTINKWTLPEMGWSSTHCIGYKLEESYKLCCQLIELGADIYKQDKGGHQALHGKVKQKYEECTDQRQEYIPEEDCFGRTILHYFCLSENIDKEILPLLLQLSDVNKRDRYGNTALHCLSKRRDMDTMNHLPELIDVFVRLGADVNVFDEFGHSALFYLRKVMDSRLTTILTSSDVDLNKDNGDGMSLLHYLCVMRPTESLKQIISKADDVNKPISQDICSAVMEEQTVLVQGSTALHLVCRTHNADVDVMEMLIQRGADINAKDRFLRTPLHIICDYPEEICNDRQYWRAFPSSKNTSEARKAICQLLLEKGSNWHLLDSDNQPALHGYFKYRFKK